MSQPHSQPHNEHNEYDVIVLGCGLSGCLAVHNILSLKKDAKVLVIEKTAAPATKVQDLSAAGAATSTAPPPSPSPSPPSPSDSSSAALYTHNPWGWGKHLYTQNTLHIIGKALHHGPSSRSWRQEFHTLDTSHFFLKNDLFSLDHRDLWDQKSLFKHPKVLAPSSWHTLTHILKDLAPHPQDQNSSKQINTLLQTLKTQHPQFWQDLSPSAPTFFSRAITALAYFFGFTEDILSDRRAMKSFLVHLELYFNQHMLLGPWQKMCQLLLDEAQQQTSSIITLRYHCTAQKGYWDPLQSLFHIPTSQETFKSPMLVVCTNPWNFDDSFDTTTLPEKWQKCLHSLTFNHSPSSLVVLISHLPLPKDHKAPPWSSLPPLFFFPYEKVSAFAQHNTLLFSQALPYENSLHTHQAIKTIRSLKRAKNLLAHHLSAVLPETYLAILPYGASAFHKDWKPPTMAQPSFFFCGSHYGPYLQRDHNLEASLQTLRSALSH